ncbi:MAG: hypothetical protein RI897_3296 [Verrucomicrobiota bacterium]
MVRVQVISAEDPEVCAGEPHHGLEVVLELEGAGVVAAWLELGEVDEPVASEHFESGREGVGLPVCDGLHGGGEAGVVTDDGLLVGGDLRHFQESSADREKVIRVVEVRGQRSVADVFGECV